MATQVRTILTDRLTRESQHANLPPSDLDEIVELWTEFLKNDQAMTGLLESLMASVSVVEEIVQMVTGQRAYEANSKVITTADQILNTAINVKR